MSEGTTKPNGSREMNVQENDESVQRRIEEAGYDVKVNALEARFSKEKIQESDNNSGAADSAKTAKAGNHTMVPNKATIAFKPLIPFIASGAKAKLKDSKSRGKDSKTSKPKTATTKTDRNADDDRI